MNRMREAKVLCVLAFACAALAQPPLPSWNDGASKKAIVDFVSTVTKEGSAGFVPPAERIAVFDNDGTLWCEQPFYVQGLFVRDRIKALAGKHPEWKDTEPFKTVLTNDVKGLAPLGVKGMLELTMASHAGMSTDEFSAIVADWLRTARHPQYHVPFESLAYQPMLEVLAYLRANGFKTYIVSGGGVEFVRVFSSRLYGIPPEQVIGSTIETKFEMIDGKPVIMREPKINFMNDKEGKALAIERIIGRRPVMAFGNSDGDLYMLQWTTGGEGPRFGLIVHHTDAEREYAYDYPSPVGQLHKALEEAPSRGWAVVNMKTDWKTIFPSP
jgi:phosphoserine phosphatase